MRAAAPSNLRYMRALATHRFQQRLNAARPEIQKAFEKQLNQLLRDLRHPSLRAKKYDEIRGLWQARVTGSWRFYFRIEADAYVLDTVRPPPK
jgi:hypothetical protein